MQIVGRSINLPEVIENPEHCCSITASTSKPCTERHLFMKLHRHPSVDPCILLQGFGSPDAEIGVINRQIYIGTAHRNNPGIRKIDNIIPVDRSKHRLKRMIPIITFTCYKKTEIDLSKGFN